MAVRHSCTGSGSLSCSKGCGRIPFKRTTSAGTPTAVEFAAAIESLYRSPEERARIAAEGERRIEQFDAPKVARLFLAAVSGDLRRVTSSAK
jgi:hypothetical protein